MLNCYCCCVDCGVVTDVTWIVELDCSLPYGPSFQGMKNLRVQANINGDGGVDYEKFKISS